LQISSNDWQELRFSQLSFAFTFYHKSKLRKQESVALISYTGNLQNCSNDVNMSSIKPPERYNNKVAPTALELSSSGSNFRPRSGTEMSQI
jgi:hypothetical protein